MLIIPVLPAGPLALPRSMAGGMISNRCQQHHLSRGLS
jgi:hypothetical protein